MNNCKKLTKKQNLRFMNWISQTSKAERSSSQTFLRNIKILMYYSTMLEFLTKLKIKAKGHLESCQNTLLAQISHVNQK